MATQVINIYKAPDGWQTNPDYLYIGRYNSRFGLQRSVWHNPYSMKALAHLPLNKHEKRANVINKFAAYLSMNNDLITRLPELEDKILVCYCHPQKCHGDVLCKWQTWLRTLAYQNPVAEATLEAWRNPKPVIEVDWNTTEIFDLSDDEYKRLAS